MDRQERTQLSERERQLVKLAANGHTDSSIAHQLGISEATVSTYWGRVRIKVGHFSRTELIAKLIREELDSVLSELREQNRALIDELQKTSGKEWGDPRANYYRKLIMQAPDAILIVTGDGTLEAINDEASRLFGYDPGELEGQSLQLLVPDRYRQIHVQHRIAYVGNPQKRKMAEHMPSPGRRKDGSEFPIAASLSPVETSSGIRIMCVVRAM